MSERRSPRRPPLRCCSRLPAMQRSPDGPSLAIDERRAIISRRSETVSQNAGRTSRRPVGLVAVLTPADKQCLPRTPLCPFLSAELIPYSRHGEESGPSEKARQNPEIESASSKASRPDVQPIGPALAELLNPAINRGESGIGSSTGLQPPPDNSWDRRSGGEAAAHRARASTRGTNDQVAKRDADTKRGDRDDASLPPPPATRSAWQGGGEQKASTNPRSANSRPPITAPRPPSPRSIRNWQNNSASPPRKKTPPRWRGRRATRWRRSASPPPPMRWNALIREGRPEFKGEDGQIKIWTPHRPPRPEKSEGGQPLRDQVRIRAEGRPAHRDRRTGRGHRAQRPHPGAARRHRLAARPTPWPR